jgi:hypothetical protein
MQSLYALTFPAFSKQIFLENVSTQEVYIRKEFKALHKHIIFLFFTEATISSGF